MGIKPYPTVPDTTCSGTGLGAGLRDGGVLGRGGMGVVYKARTWPEPLVALKMILAGGQPGGASWPRFRTEAEAVARLQHPNIVQIHEVGESTDGLPSARWSSSRAATWPTGLDGKPLPARQAARLVETLARAVHLAHSRGVVHRDLKPGKRPADARTARPRSPTSAWPGSWTATAARPGRAR